MHSSNAHVPSNGPVKIAVKLAGNRFRIMCLNADGSDGLITLCQNLSEARAKARSEVDAHLARLRKERLAVFLQPDRPRQIRVQKWQGDATSGAWQTLERKEGGYDFTFYDHPPKKPRHKYNYH
jgi:hypothetical protein